MRSLTSAFVLSLCLLVSDLAAPALAASAGDWRADIDSLVMQVQANDPGAFVRCGKLTFLRRAAALKTSLSSMTEEQRMTGAMQLIALIGDGHTQLEPNRPDFAIWYPIRIYQFSDGYYVTGAHRSVAALAGAQLLEVAGRPVGEVVDAARSLRGADNPSGKKEEVFAFSNAALMKGLGYADAAGLLRIKVRLQDGRIVERTLEPHRTDDPRFDKDDSTFEWHFQAEMGGPPIGTPDDWIGDYRGLTYSAFRTTDTSRPPRLMNRRQFVAVPLTTADAFYIQANFVGEDFDQLFRQALAQVDQVKPKRLIVDLRYNFGGDGSFVPGMAREFIKRQEAPPWKELYLVTGRRTLSAGIMAAVAIMHNTELTVIGEPMAAPINSYGDPIEIPFPRTGMKLSISTVWHELGEYTDIAEFTPVDIPVEMSFADYAAGKDPAVDPILSGAETRSIGVIALAEGGAAAARVYHERLAQFSRYPWWAPPPEMVLREVTHKLMRQKRYEDAVALAALNSEIHPDVWNTWYNLGIAQRAAGKNREGLESWRQVLLLDPENSNKDEIFKAFMNAGATLVLPH